MTTVALRGIWKSFGKTQALRDVTFECKHGEMFCLLGPSGAGKSTTIRILAGLARPDRGQVLMDGKDVTHLLTQERDVAIAFESYALYPQLTVFDNLAFPLRAPVRRHQYPPSAVEAEVRRIAQLLSLDELLHRYPRELSGGQRQRVSLGRALVRRPRVYLLDEPIAHLDAKLRHRMRGELKKIQSELGITTVYATPDQLEALSMADTVAVLNKGQIEQIGPPHELFDRPGNTFVAQFVGDPPMNLLDATVQGDRFIVDGAAVAYTIPMPATNRPPLSGKIGSERIKIGIRPKDITLVSPEAETAHVRGKARVVETLGETTVVTVDINGHMLKVKVPTAQAPERENQVGLVYEASRFHYFDAITGKRL